MEKRTFTYKHKPAFISFILIYILCFVLAYWMIDNSHFLSEKFGKLVLVQLGISRSNLLWKVPYGIVFSLPLLFFGLRTLLWNLMSFYEFTSSDIRLLTGTLSRKERFYSMADFYEISFKQNVLETPFRIGSLILTPHVGKPLFVRGVYNVKSVVESLRSGH